MAENKLDHHHAAFPVLDKETGKILNYGQLRRNPKYANTWNMSYANEMFRLCQGVGTRDGGFGKQIKGTDTFHVVHFEEISKYRLREVCHTSVVCEVRPGKKDPNRNRINICGTNVSYPGDVGTKKYSLKIFKIIINSNISRQGDRFD